MSDDTERRRGHGRRQSDDTPTDRLGEGEAGEVVRAAVARAELAEHAADKEREALEVERAEYRTARRHDEQERWNDTSARRRFSRNSEGDRQDLYEGSFGDYDPTTRSRDE